MNPVDLGANTVKKARDIIGSIRRQMPGARMIGEYAVRLVTRDIGRRLGISSEPTRGSVNGQSDQ